MAITEKEFRDLKKSAEDARTETDKALGAYDQDMKKLKEVYGVDSLGKAEVLLDDLLDAKEKTSSAYETAFKEFQDKLGNKI